jgi:site-specific recombinase XerD
MTEKAYRYAYTKFQKQTGIKATVQQLRKSYATIAVGANVPADVLRVIFGHADISTTLNIYAEVRDERITSAAELLNQTDLATKKST